MNVCALFQEHVATSWSNQRHLDRTSDIASPTERFMLR